MEDRKTFAASGRRVFSLSEKQKDIRKIEIPKAFVKATETFSFTENNTSEEILATTGNDKHKQDSVNLLVTMQNTGLAANNNVTDKPEVVAREPRPRITRRMSSTIRRIQEKIRKEQLKDNNNNDVTVKSDRDGQHPQYPQHQPRGYRSVAKSAVAAVRSARRQRSMSRTKQGKIKCDQLQRPYRRWLGVSTCVAPDTRFIVGPKQDDVVSGKAAEKCKNNNETNDGSENCSSENFQQHSSQGDPDTCATENEVLVEVEESGCGSQNMVDFDEVNLSSFLQSKSVEHQTCNDDDSGASEQSISSTNQSNRERRPKQRRKLLRFRESKSSPPPNLERNPDALDENDIPVFPLVEPTKEVTEELALPTGEDCEVRQSVSETELYRCTSQSQPSDPIEVAVTHPHVESLPRDDHHTESPVPFEFSLQLLQNDEVTMDSEGMPVNYTSKDNVNLELEKEFVKSYSLEGKECEKFLSTLEFTPQTREEKPAQDETMKHACTTNDEVDSFALELAHEQTDEEKSYHSEVSIQLLGKDIEIDFMTPNQGIQMAEMAPQCENPAMSGQCLSDDTSLQQDQGEEKDDSTSGLLAVKDVGACAISASFSQFIEVETKEPVVDQSLLSLKDESGLSELIPRSRDHEKKFTATKSQTSDEESVPLTQEVSLPLPGSVEEEYNIERCVQSTNSNKKNTESSSQNEMAEIEKDGTESQLRSSAEDENCVPEPLGCSSRPKQDSPDSESTSESLDSAKKECSQIESSQVSQDQMRDDNAAEHQNLIVIVDASHDSPSTTSPDLRNEEVAIDSAAVHSPTIKQTSEPLVSELSYNPEGKPENESETTPMHIPVIQKVQTTKSDCSTKQEIEEKGGNDDKKSFTGQSKTIREPLSPSIKIIKPTKKQRTKKDQSSLTSPSISNASGFPMRAAKSAKGKSPSFHPADNASDQGGLAGNVVSKATFNVYPPVPPLPPPSPPSWRATTLQHHKHPNKQLAKDGTATTRGYHAKGNSLRQEMRTFRDRQLFEVRAYSTPSSYTIRTLAKKVKKGLEKKEYINVQAIRDCEGTLPGQLAFKKGQIIKQLDTGLRDVDGMFYGYYRVGRLRRKVSGIYPSTHVSLFFDSDEEPGNDNDGGDGLDGDCGNARTVGAASSAGVGGNGGCDGFKRDGLHSRNL